MSFQWKRNYLRCWNKCIRKNPIGAIFHTETLNCQLQSRVSIIQGVNSTSFDMKNSRFDFTPCHSPSITTMVQHLSKRVMIISQSISSLLFHSPLITSTLDLAGSCKHPLQSISKTSPFLTASNDAPLTLVIASQCSSHGLCRLVIISYSLESIWPIVVDSVKEITFPTTEDRLVTHFATSAFEVVILLVYFSRDNC